MLCDLQNQKQEDSGRPPSSGTLRLHTPPPLPALQHTHTNTRARIPAQTDRQIDTCILSHTELRDAHKRISYYQTDTQTRTHTHTRTHAHTHTHTHTLTHTPKVSCCKT